MAQYSWDVPHEKECALGVYEDILKQHGITFNALLKGRNLTSLRASLDLLIEDGKIKQEITSGLEDFQEAEKFYPVHSDICRALFGNTSASG
jgi:hypothetical protein